MLLVREATLLRRLSATAGPHSRTLFAITKAGAEVSRAPVVSAMPLWPAEEGKYLPIIRAESWPQNAHGVVGYPPLPSKHTLIYPHTYPHISPIPEGGVFRWITG